MATASEYIRTLQLPDGSFQGDTWGEIDTRFSFCAIAALSLMDCLHVVDVAAATKYVCRTLNFDGGFGCVPGSETHAGQIYCCVSMLAIVKQVHRIDADMVAWWLCERQLPSGGLNGRFAYCSDVCTYVYACIIYE